MKGFRRKRVKREQNLGQAVLEELEDRFQLLGLVCDTLAAVDATRVIDEVGRSVLINLYPHRTDIIQKGVQILPRQLRTSVDAKCLSMKY